MVAVPNTRARLSHALTIRARGRTIGAVHQWAPAQGRDIDTEYEVEPNSVGLPVDVIPQVMGRREIRIARYDTYPEIMEEVFGTSELEVLTDQYRPFTLREVWRGPARGAVAQIGNAIAGAVGAFDAARGNAVAAAAASSINNPFLGLIDGITGPLLADMRIYTYTGCWFTDLGRQMDTKGDRVVSVEATLVFTDRRRVA